MTMVKQDVIAKVMRANSHYIEWVTLLKEGKHPCPACLREMVEVVDARTKKKTGHMWQCKRCHKKTGLQVMIG